MASRTSDDIQVKDLDNWKRGQISYFSKSREQEDALKTAYNVIFDYDAIVRPRGSFDLSGIPDLPSGLTPLGCDFPFKRADETEGLLNLFTDGVTAWLYVLKADLTGWTKFTGFTFDITKVPSFTQIAGVVVIGNGVQNFTYYEIATDTLKQLSLVANPTATPTATTAGFSGTAAIDYYYKVAFGGVGGSTKMTPFVKVTSSTIRDTWAGLKSVMIDISSFVIDPNAKNWAIYVASVSTGTGAPTDSEYLKIVDSLPTTQKQYTDTGAQTLLESAPIENTTEGIKAPYFNNISGRLWAIGADGLVYWGGDIGKELYFGSANGSDSYKINSGSNEKAMAITLGRDNAGTTCINLLTRTMAGQGAIWDIYATTNSITANGQTFSTGTYQFKKREGDDGTDAPYSVIRANNNAYYLSMDGFKSTGVKPNVSGIQSTDIISSAIRDRVLNLAQSNLSKTYSAYYDEALYWSLAYGAQKNNEIWMYDILHGGIWSIWRIESDCIFRWASTKNSSPSLYVRQGNKLLRYYKNSHSHADLGVPFEAYIESGLIPFAKDNKLEWVHLLKNIWQFDQAVGIADLVVNVHSKNGDIIKSASVPFNEASTSNSQSGWDAIRPTETSTISRGAWNNRSWDESLADLLTFKDPSDKKVSQKVRKNAAYMSFSVKSNTKDTYYELSHLSMLFTYIGVGVEFLSQKGVIKI
jgi:hypothetical protein